MLPIFGHIRRLVGLDFHDSLDMPNNGGNHKCVYVDAPVI